MSNAAGGVSASNDGLGLDPQATGHLHSNGDFCQERAVVAPAWWPVAMFTEDQLRAAVAAERERCAKWLRDNYQDHATIASLCDAMVATPMMSVDGGKDIPL